MSLRYYIHKVKEIWQLKKLRQILNNEPDQGENDLIFIISSGRSGSTLLRKLLIEYAEIHIPPESGIFIPELAKLYINNSNWINSIEMAIELFLKLDLNEYWKLDLDSLKKELICVPKQDQHLKKLISIFYKQHANTVNNTQVLYGDKSPILSLNLNWVTTLYPNAKFVHLIRDPYDVTYSRMTNFGESLEIASSRWIWTVKEVKKYQSKVNFYEIQYDKLVEDSEEIIRKLVGFLGIKKRKEQESMYLKLGDEKLPHHKKLLNEVQHYSFEKYKVFSDLELKYLDKRFKKFT